MVTEKRIQTLRAVLSRRQDDLHVVLDNVHDPHNASAVLRTCDGFGVGTVHRLSTDNPFPEISKGVSGYTRKWLFLRDYQSAFDCITSLRALGLRVVATHINKDSKSHLEVDWTIPTAIVLGNEHRGCTEDVVSMADEQVYVPMQGMAQSLNVSVAAGVLLGEAWRQRFIDGYFPVPWTEKKEELFQLWLEREKEKG